MRYRREIDGLRAVAVMPVLLFHAGFERFGGGFVGVDVFFVISGYLITSILLAEKALGGFSYAGFYERRARRILPALFFVMLVCLPAAWLWLLPTHFMEFARSMIAVALFASNLFFWHEVNYFAVTTELKPLLHTWSLAVEEQYYLLFPPLLMLLWPLGRRRLLGLFAAALLASLLLANWATAIKPVASFYLLPTRAWELLLGACTALWLMPQSQPQPQPAKPAALAAALSMLGLLLIVYAALVFDKSTPSPGLASLVPTVGTALIILCASERNWTGRLLASRPLVALGLISYSCYLWHQPLFAFARQASLAPLRPLHFVGLIGLTLVLGAVSWRWVERPFRDRQRFDRGAIFSLAATSSMVMIAIGLAGQFSRGFEALRFTPAQLALLAYSAYDRAPVYREGRCFLRPEQQAPDFATECAAGPGPSLLLWGDSHAAALSSGLRARFGNVAQYTASACAPALGLTINEHQRCQAINDFALSEVGRHRPERILLHANWWVYDGRAPMGEHLAMTLEAIRRVSPASQVFVLGNVPHWQPSLPTALWRSGVVLQQPARLAAPMLPALRRIDRDYRAVAERSGAVFLSALDLLCDASHCSAVVDMSGRFQPLVWDSAHLTEAGALMLAQQLQPPLAATQPISR